jgi:hypothetical protein
VRALFTTVILPFVIEEKRNCERRQPLSGFVRMWEWKIGLLQVKNTFKGSHVSGLPALHWNAQNVLNRISRALSRSGINTVVIPGTNVYVFLHCSVKHDLDLRDKPRMRARECGKVYIGPTNEHHLHIWLCQHWLIRASTTVIVSCSTTAFTATKISRSRDRAS